MQLGSVLACWFVGRGPKTGVLSRTVFWVWGGFLGLGEVRDLYRKVGDIGGLHFHQVPSKSVPRGAKTSQKTVYLRILIFYFRLKWPRTAPGPISLAPARKISMTDLFSGLYDLMGPKTVRFSVLQAWP